MCCSLSNTQRTKVSPRSRCKADAYNCETSNGEVISYYTRQRGKQDARCYTCFFTSNEQDSGRLSSLHTCHRFHMTTERPKCRGTELNLAR